MRSKEVLEEICCPTIKYPLCIP